MKETGIIMSGNHPLKILDGTKTMTRRVINPQPVIIECNARRYSLAYKRMIFEEPIMIIKVCPYGQVGDRLWVRETWWKPPEELWPYTLYKAQYPREDWPQDWGLKWRPSIFMPRWASQINLEITEVRVERLQEITEDDAKREGIKQLHFTTGMKINCIPQFIELWDSLNAKRGYSWEVNPWVWVISFRIIK